MSGELSVLGEYNGCRIRVKPDEFEYVNATDMAKACGKEWKHYRSNQATQEFLDELSRSVGIPTDQLVVGISTGPNDQRGTWVHPHVAIDFAHWLSPEFKVWCIQKLDVLFRTGTVSVHKEHSEAVLCRAIGDIGTVLVGIQELLTRQTGDVAIMRSDIDDLKNRQRKIEENVACLKTKSDGERKDFGSWVHQAFACVIVERFADKCPVCESVRIANYPWFTLPNWELHHWRMKGGNNPNIAFPCCADCHSKLTTNYTMHDELESLFVMIQKWALPGVESNRPKR